MYYIVFDGVDAGYSLTSLNDAMMYVRKGYTLIGYAEDLESSRQMIKKFMTSLDDKYADLKLNDIDFSNGGATE